MRGGKMSKVTHQTIKEAEEEKQMRLETKYHKAYGKVEERLWALKICPDDMEIHNAMGDIFEAIQKQRPWKPQKKEQGLYYQCKCGYLFTHPLEIDDYCKECGQKLDGGVEK